MRPYIGAAKIATSLLLLFNGAGAVYGGSSLMLQPDGSGLGMGPEWLQYSPFSNYLIPGMILFLVNGVFSFWCLVLLWRKPGQAWGWVAAQGILLGGWLLVQILMLRTFNAMHAKMGLTAIGLLGCAAWLRSMRVANPESADTMSSRNKTYCLPFLWLFVAATSFCFSP